MAKVPAHGTAFRWNTYTRAVYCMHTMLQSAAKKKETFNASYLSTNQSHVFTNGLHLTHLSPLTSPSTEPTPGTNSCRTDLLSVSQAQQAFASRGLGTCTFPSGSSAGQLVLTHVCAVGHLPGGTFPPPPVPGRASLSGLFSSSVHGTKCPLCSLL